MKIDFGRIKFTKEQDGDHISIEFSGKSGYDEVVERFAQFSRAIGYAEQTINSYLYPEELEEAKDETED